MYHSRIRLDTEESHNEVVKMANSLAQNQTGSLPDGRLYFYGYINLFDAQYLNIKTVSNNSHLCFRTATVIKQNLNTVGYVKSVQNGCGHIFNIFNI
jgi:hypothetical protein